jgi:hypothetical protein
VKGDSQLVIKQVKGECSCHDPQLAAYLLHVQKLQKDFEVLDLQHVPRANNAVTDELSAKASTWAPVLDGVFEWTLKLAVPVALIAWSPQRIIGVTEDSVHPSAQDPEAQVGPDVCITKIRTYLMDNILPEDHASADQITRLAKRYTLVEGDLYRCGTNGILI